MDSYHDESDEDTTLSAIDLDSFADLDAALSGFADALREGTLYFTHAENRDLYELATRVRAMTAAPADIVAAAAALAGQLDVTIPYSRTQAGYESAHGLAIYVPARGGGLEAAYTGAGVVWSARTTWDEFLSDFTP